jgi:hypothetical protein
MHTDRYCPNCRQMVKPKVDVSAMTKALAILTYGLVVLYAWSVGHWLEGIMVGAVVALIVGGIIGAVSLIRSCPICQTRQLEHAAPVP